MHTGFSRFVNFWAGSSLCLAYLATILVKSGVIRLGEGGVKTIAYSCIVLIFLDLLFLLEYMSVLYYKEDDRNSGDQ